MKFTVYQNSRQGGRQYNQDRLGYSYSRDALLLVVADGMGGHLHGEIAAQIAVELLTDQFQKKAQPILKSPNQFLQDALMQCHRAIFDYASKHQLLEIPRTTVVAGIIQDGILHWAHVGDSRLYLLRKNEILLQTKDHSKVQKLLNDGKITAEEALFHPERNKIYNCLGGTLKPEIELGGKIVLCDNDTLLLCTDGLWGGVTESQLIHFLSSFPVLFSIPQLMDQAELHGGKFADNISALGINWHDADDQFFSENAFVSTQKLDVNTISTHIDPSSVGANITDEDIEAAIAEIQAAIQKYSK
ncbi:PP2C family protein-serine/threonine phosphatase [Iodobacter arcticus]|uniref:PP2C family protein-serine/threonine phosphatase n=1 Tax=Iodobacter arcticus TaxID=590593 RepID=A0ABW2QXM0_9NEIS